MSCQMSVLFVYSSAQIMLYSGSRSHNLSDLIVMSATELSDRFPQIPGKFLEVMCHLLISSISLLSIQNAVLPHVRRLRLHFYVVCIE